MFTGLRKLPSHFNPDLKISPEFPRGFSFHLQPKFPRGFPPPTIPQSPGIPRGIREILPAWILINFVYKFVYSAPGFYKCDQLLYTFEGGFTHLCNIDGILNWIF